MDSSSFLRILMVFVWMAGTCQAVYQRWLPDTNFENPANWNTNRAPCGNDVVIIPDESPVVYIQMNTTLKELVLPKNGELILGQNSGLSFTDGSSAVATDDCPDSGGDLEFTAIHPKAWLNPSSWCYTSTQRGDCDTQAALLDVQKIPCAFDDVIFPRQHSFYVGLNDQVPKLTVKSVKIAGTSLTSTSLASYLTSDEGRRMFKTANQSSTQTRIDVMRKACTDMRGCACGNDQPEIASKICSYVEKTCRRPRCKNTVQPFGACCKMCGAVFNITTGYGFDFKSFSDIIMNDFLQGSSDINATMLITYEGWLQIALNDVTGEKSSKLARSIKADMDNDVTIGGHKYAVDSIQLSFSTGNPLTPYAHTGGPSMAGGAIAGIVIAVIIILVILAIVVIVFVFHRTGREIPVNIPKLPSVRVPSLPRMPIRFQRSTSRLPAQPQTAAHVDPGFANPLYDTSPFDDGNEQVKEMEMITASQESQPTFDASGAGFNNPLYGAGGAMFSDPTKADDEQIKDPSAKPEATTPPPTPSSPTTSVLIDFQKDSADDSTI